MHKKITVKRDGRGINILMLIILQYRCISIYHIVQNLHNVKHLQCYRKLFLNFANCNMSIISQQSWKKTFCRINLFFKKGSKEVETATNSEIIEYKIHFSYMHCDQNYYLVYNEAILMKHGG